MANKPAIPWGYYQSLRQNAPEKSDVDPVEVAVSGMRAEAVQDAILNGSSPDVTARANAMSRQIGEHPAMIEDQLDDAQRGLDAQALGRVAQDHPAIGAHLADNPRAAVVAQGDHASLGLLGQTWDVVKGLGAGLQSGYYQAAAMAADTNKTFHGIASTLAYPIDAALATVGNMTGMFNFDPDQAKAAFDATQDKASASYQAKAKDLMPKTDNWWLAQAYNAAASMPVSLGAMAITLATRNPAAGAGAMGALQGASSYQEGLRGGMQTGQAIRYGLEQGIPEAAFEMAPESALLADTLGRASIIKTAKDFLGKEVGGEVATQLVQSFSDWVNNRKGGTYNEWLAQLPEELAATAVSAGMGAAFQVGASKAAVRAFDAAAGVAGKVQEAHAARKEASAIDAFGRAAEQSSMRKLDPEAYQELMRSVGETNGMTHVFVPGETVQAYMQSDSYDQYTDPMGAFAADVAEAVQTGGDLVLPVEFAFGALPGTPAWNAMKEDMRFAPGGMSVREATEFRDTINQKMDDVLAKVDEINAQQDGARQQIVERVRKMLQDAGYTPDAANVQAELIGAREAARAARLGQELTGLEFDTKIEQVLPPALAAARKADATDLVINAMRKGKPATVQQGDTLLEWIAKRGGLNDTGGDLKSMGLDTWHLRMPAPGKKGKNGKPARPTPIRGRKQILRDFDPRQGAMGGISGAGDYGLDTTLRATIEAGYFPELQGMANQAGVDQLDSQMLMDAIAEELAGKPRHAEESKTDPMRAAADELRQLLAERGLDPDGMSDAELRAAIGQLSSSKEGGRGFDQAAYHGSPHIFDRFSLDHIGTGEGAQAYGWGLYFAGKREIADWYRKTLSGKVMPKLDGKDLIDFWNNSSLDELESLVSSLNIEDIGIHGIAGDAVRKEVESNGLYQIGDILRQAWLKSSDSIIDGLKYEADTQRSKAQKALQAGDNVDARSYAAGAAIADALANSGRFKDAHKGRIYTVDIPEDNEYLLWDKPLSEQSDNVRKALESVYEDANPESEDYAPDEQGQSVYRRLTQMRGSDREASLALHNAGIAGIKYFDGVSRRQGEGSFNYVVFDDSYISIQSYDQSQPDGPRGRIIFNPGQRPIIQLFQSRNLSTLLHEISHQWLEELRADAALPEAPDQLKADWQAVQDWFAENGHAIGDDGAIPVDAHELFARGGERYLMEGHAPSSALQGLFDRFRSWLLAIYKTVADLRSPITPEIREVFDRLLATDEEISAAREKLALEPLFKDAAAAGMAGPEFAAYSATVQAAREKASGDLLAKTMAAIKRRETKRFNDERREVVAEETDRLMQAPILRSIELMKQAPISKEWLQEEFGLDAVDLMPKRVPPLYKPGGEHPDAIAEEAGFDSGRQMLEVLFGQEDVHRQARKAGDKRTMRQRMIDAAADAEMARRYGDDPFNDGSIEREAMEAINNEQQGEVIASEVRVLARSTGNRPTPYAIARQWARQKVRGGTVAQEASPAAVQRHSRAVAKAGRAAEEAFLKGDREAAFKAKQQQMISSTLLAEAKLALDEVQAAQERMAKVAAAKTMKSVDQDYLERAQSLLEAVDLRPRSQRSIDRQAKWEAWAQDRRAEGFDVVVPDSYAATLDGQHWSRLSVEGLLGLDEAVKQVMHLGRLEQTLIDNQEEREFEAVVSEAVDSAGNIEGPPPAGLQERDWRDALNSKVLAADAALLKMETVFDWLDGGNINGVFNRIVFRPIAEAQGRAQDMQQDYMGRVRDLFGAIPAEQVSRWSDKVQTPFYDKFTGKPFAPMRHRLIAMAMNIGNEGNMQRLADGYGWNAGAIEAHLNETLTAEEWQFVQGVWDTIETLWPEMAALERRVNGVEPEKVEARSFTTPHGEMRGGYYPAIYDSTLSSMAEDRTSSPESVLFEPLTTKATTRAGATKARAQKVSEPILLDLGVIQRHLGEVIHDLTHREAVMQAWKFLSNRRVSASIDEALGPEIRKQLRPWVKFVANSWAMDRAGNEGLGKFFSKMRTNGTIVGMGFRVTTMMTQIAGYSNSIEVVGEAAMAKAIAQTSRAPIETTRFVMERSAEMRHRMDTMDRDLRTELVRLEATNPATKAARALVDGKRFFFHGIGWMDRVVTVPTWIAAYNKALLGGLSEEDAAYAGDKAVRVSQGAGAPKDLAAAVRGTGKYGEALKLFTTFFSYFSATYQRERTLARDMRGKDARIPRNLPKLMARAWWLLIVPPLLTEVMRGVAGGNAGPDDDEWWLQWTMRKLLANAVGPIPFLRDAFEPSWNKAINGRVYSSGSTPIQRAQDAIQKAAGDVGNVARGDPTKHATKDILEATGYVTGLVPGQVASSVQFLVDVGNGDQRPQDVGDWWHGLSTGKMEKKH